MHAIEEQIIQGAMPASVVSESRINIDERDAFFKGKLPDCCRVSVNQPVHAFRILRMIRSLAIELSQSGSPA